MRFFRTGVATGLLAASLLLTRGALGQTAGELAAGRQLFEEALRDEEHGRLALAVEKYRQVQKIRDTAPIQYRIGATLEGLGKIVQAVEAYTAAVRLGSASAEHAEVARAAQRRLDALSPKVAHLAVRLPERSPPDAEIMVDSAPVTTQALGDVALDPGPHVVTVTARGARPFRGQVTLAEGGRVELPVVLEPEAPPAPPAPPPAAGGSSSLRTIGIVTGAAGGVLVLSGVIVLALRSGAISTLNESCPNGSCPAAREDELRSTRDRALVEGPVGGGLLTLGALAVATGIILFTVAGSDSKTTRARVVPSPGSLGATLNLARTF